MLDDVVIPLRLLESLVARGSHAQGDGRGRLFDVRRWTDMPRGGHFAATEEPVLLAMDIAAFYEDRGL